MHLYIYTSIHLFIYSSTHLHIYTSMYTSIHLYIYTSIHLFIFTSIHLYVHLFIYTSIHLFIHISIHIYNIHICMGRLYTCRQPLGFESGRGGVGADSSIDGQMISKSISWSHGTQSVNSLWP